MNNRLKSRYKGKRFSRLGKERGAAIAAILSSAATWALPRVLPQEVVTKELIKISMAISLPIKFITGWLPISIIELFLIAMIPALIYLIWSMIRKPEEALPSEGGVISSCLVIVGVMLTLFNITLGFAYERTPLRQELGYAEAAVNKETLKAAITTLLDVGQEARKKADFEGRTVRSYGRQLQADYKVLALEQPAYAGQAALPKRAILSVPMSYLGVGGMYSPFTCEAMINGDATNPSIPFTVAHEMAHSLGFARENEANFSAFLVCIQSDDAAVRYSGCFTGLLYMLPAYRRADPENYAELYNSIDEAVRLDFAEYFDHIEKYEGSVNDFHSKINDLFLKSNGQSEGVASYGLIVNLIVEWNEANGVS